MKKCPVCKQAMERNHRNCILSLFKQDKIQSVKEWEAMCEPKKVIIKVKVSDL